MHGAMAAGPLQSHIIYHCHTSASPSFTPMADWEVPVTADKGGERLSLLRDELAHYVGQMQGLEREQPHGDFEDESHRLPTVEPEVPKQTCP